MLKLLAGKYKGRSVKTPNCCSVRPTTARVRQRLFDILAGLWKDSIGLDAFAGSGAIGFEALSRGAKHVYALEKSKSTYTLIQQSANHLGLNTESYTCKNQAFEQWWEQTSVEVKHSLDWVYLDPPYQYPELLKLLQKVFTHGVLLEQTIVILEHGGSFYEQDILKALELEYKLAPTRTVPCGDSVLTLFVVGS
jgi:16S rRNA (guanine966-N2)-methyltransferase